VNVNFWRQAETAEALLRLTTRIEQRARMVHKNLDDLWDIARDQRRELPTLLVADALGIDYCDVMRIERLVAKHWLFGYLYEQSADQVTRIQDATIIERVGECRRCGFVECSCLQDFPERAP
jgi:hypothetical protein